MTEFIWDASDFDWARGPMDLAAARADGIVGFTYKATEATWIRHVHTGEALARARDAGIEFIGAYHVVRSTDVHAQVDYFLAYLDETAPWWRTFPGFFLQVDLELWDYDRVTAATGMAFAAALVAAQPKRVITYASRGQYGDQLTGIVTPLWNAAYGLNPVAHYPDPYRGDGSANWAPYSGRPPVFWQYGSLLRIGTQPGADCSAFRGSLADLRALITGSPQQRSTDMGYFFSTADGSQYMADPTFERYWAFVGDGSWEAVYAVAGRPPTVNVDPHMLAAGAFGAYQGIYTLPRKPSAPAPAPAVDMTAVEQAAEAGAKAGIDGATIHAAG